MSKRIVEGCLILAAPQTRRSPQFLHDSFGLWLWSKYDFFLSFSFTRRDDFHARLVLGEQRIELEASHPNYGGVRWWYACPRCSRRAARLYLPKGENSFLCRLCHDLSYESAQASRSRYYERYKSYGVGSRIIREATREWIGGRQVADLVGHPRTL